MENRYLKSITLEQKNAQHIYDVCEKIGNGVFVDMPNVEEINLPNCNDDNIFKTNFMNCPMLIVVNTKEGHRMFKKDDRLKASAILMGIEIDW